MAFEGFIRGPGVVAIAKQTPTISTSVYASGDQIGGLMTFTPMAQLAGGTGRITGWTILDKAKQSASIELHLWVGSSGPTVTSVDNGVADITDANWDMDLYLGSVIFSTYNTFSGNSVSSINCAIDYKCNINNQSVFGLMVVRGTPTYAGTTDLVLGGQTIQD